MTILLIPIAPLTRTKSRLRDFFSTEQLIELTIAMFKDLGKTLTEVNCFDQKIVYCNATEILDLAEEALCSGLEKELQLRVFG